MKDITVTFPGVVANDKINFSLQKGRNSWTVRGEWSGKISLIEDSIWNA